MEREYVARRRRASTSLTGEYHGGIIMRLALPGEMNSFGGSRRRLHGDLSFSFHSPGPAASRPLGAPFIPISISGQLFPILLISSGSALVIKVSHTPAPQSFFIAFHWLVLSFERWERLHGRSSLIRRQRLVSKTVRPAALHNLKASIASRRFPGGYRRPLRAKVAVWLILILARQQTNAD